MKPAARDIPPPDWRPWLRRKIAWLLGFKLAALVILWLLFFSPAKRVEVDSDSMWRQVVPGQQQPADGPTPSSQQDDSDNV